MSTWRNPFRDPGKHPLSRKKMSFRKKERQAQKRKVKEQEEWEQSGLLWEEFVHRKFQERGDRRSAQQLRDEEAPDGVSRSATSRPIVMKPSNKFRARGVARTAEYGRAFKRYVRELREEEDPTGHPRVRGDSQVEEADSESDLQGLPWTEV